MKPVRLTKHAQQYVLRRGFSFDEVVHAIRNSNWEPAELGRLQCKTEFSYGIEWNGKLYQTKQVRPIFVDEETEIVVITVYCYYY